MVQLAYVMDTPASAAQQPYVDRLCDQVETVSGASEEVVELFRRHPRHQFLSRLFVHDDRTGGYRDEPVAIADDCADPELLKAIYDDHALAIDVRQGRCLSSTSQPSLMARMMVEAMVRPGGRVLEIGTATGWNAALLSSLVGSRGAVVTVEIDPELAAEARRRLAARGCGNVEVLCGDGYLGAPSAGLFDSIVVTVACPHLSPHWFDQLRSDGTLLAPVALPDGAAPLVRMHGGLEPRGHFRATTWFVPVRGGAWRPWPAPYRSGSTPWLAEVLSLSERVTDWPWTAARDTMEHDFLAYLAARRGADFAAFELPGRSPREAVRLGLWQADPPGLALADGPRLRAFGDAGPESRLTQLAAEYEDLGRPRLGAWRLTWNEPAPHRLGPPGAPSLGMVLS